MERHSGALAPWQSHPTEAHLRAYWCHLLVLFGLVVKAALAQSGPLDLTSALREAVSQNPMVCAARLRVLSRLALAEGSGNQPNPELRLAVNTGITQQDASYLQQILEVAGQPDLREGVARAETQAEKFRLATIRRELAVQVARAYYGLWSRRKLLELGKVRLDLAAQLEQAARRRLDVGEIARNQFLRVQLERARAEADLIDLEADARVAAVQLNTTLGRNPDLDVVLPEQIASQVPQAPEAPFALDAPIADLSSRSESRPELARTRTEVNRARLEAELEGRARSPDLQVTAFTNPTVGVQLALVVPLWDYGIIAARQEQKEREAEALESDLANQRLQIRQQVLTAYERYQAAERRREVLRAQVDRFLSLSEMANRGYGAGFVSFLEVLDAQNSSRAAVQDYIVADANFQLSRLELHWASGGQLLPDKEESP